MRQAKPTSLGEFEELVMLAIQYLGEGAYGVPIREMLEERAERRVTVGALYTTLGRLEAKGYISSSKGEATEERGGRARMYFRIEALGNEAMNQAEQARRALRRNVREWAGGMA